jgi:hypothetical protein
VNEVYAAMDSVSIDEHERLVIALGRTAPLDALTIEDLLSWISAFASREAPQLIRDGGKRGIAAIIPTAKTLKERLGQFVAEIKNKDAKLPSQLNHDRVLNPLNELEKYLDMLQEQATKITT